MLVRILATERSSLGLLLVVGAVVWQAAGAVVLARTSSPDSALRTAFEAFVVATLVACAVLARSRRPDLRGRRSRRVLSPAALALVAVTAGAFLAFYAALGHVPVLAASAIEVCTGVLVVLCLVEGRRLRSAGVDRRWAAAGALTIVCVVVTLISTRGAPSSSASGLVTGLVLAAGAGACGAMVVVLSASASARGLRAAPLAVTRFAGASVLSGVVIVAVGSGEGVTALAWAEETLSATMTVALPLLLLQAGLLVADPVRSELVLATLPALVHVGDSIWTRHLDPVVTVLMICLVACALAAQRPRRSRETPTSRDIS